MKKKILAVSLTILMSLSFVSAYQSSKEIERIGGKDRYETSILTSKAIKESKYAIIASGENFPDAMAGGTLAVQVSAPIYLTTKDGLKDGIKEDLKAKGVKEVFVLGGKEALSKQIEEDLGKDFKITRLAGSDRYKTAEKIIDMRFVLNHERYPEFDLEHNKSVEYLASGLDFADALTASPFIGRQTSKEEFASLSFGENTSSRPNAIVIGGENAVTGKAEERIAGSDRYLTSLEIAKEYGKKYDFDTVIIANGENFPDAISAVNLSFLYDAPIVLAEKNKSNEKVLEYISSKAKKIIVVGGNQVISDKVLAENYYGKSSLFEYAAKKLQMEETKDFVFSKNQNQDILSLILEKLDASELVATIDSDKAIEMTKDLNIKGQIDGISRRQLAILRSILDIDNKSLEDMFENKETIANGIDLIAEKIEKNSNIKASKRVELSDLQAGQKLASYLGQTKMFNDTKAFKLGVEVVSQKITTGFNVKEDKLEESFNPNTSLVYGHSDIKHLKQLLDLMRIYGLKAKLEIQAKTSAFEYLLEWGPIPEPSEDYEVVKVSDDLYLANAKEYDLNIEFENKEDIEKFDSLINRYAKKNSGNEEGKGLIYASWWQPLYSSKNKLEKGFNNIKNNTFSLDGYDFITFSKNEDAENISEKIKKVEGVKDYKTEDLWVNDAFFRYLNGQAE